MQRVRQLLQLRTRLGRHRLTGVGLEGALGVRRGRRHKRCLVRSRVLSVQPVMRSERAARLVPHRGRARRHGWLKREISALLLGAGGAQLAQVALVQLVPSLHLIQKVAVAGHQGLALLGGDLRPEGEVALGLAAHHLSESLHALPMRPRNVLHSFRDVAPPLSAGNLRRERRLEGAGAPQLFLLAPLELALPLLLLAPSLHRPLLKEHVAVVVQVTHTVRLRLSAVDASERHDLPLMASRGRAGQHVREALGQYVRLPLDVHRRAGARAT
mmetsp:Transcript_25881/g.83599  ORF Transcript_25881/g.83599 Transcript_25881/m.83599 type:complete len:271 (+) Transcript_25881:1735-2547(+)